jgi:hypothetical protein
LSCIPSISSIIRALSWKDVEFYLRFFLHLLRWLYGFCLSNSLVLKDVFQNDLASREWNNSCESLLPPGQAVEVDSESVGIQWGLNSGDLLWHRASCFHSGLMMQDSTILVTCVLSLHWVKNRNEQRKCYLVTWQKPLFFFNNHDKKNLMILILSQ